MIEMEYEYLLRSTGNTNRNYKNGADADIYRSLETAHKNLETKTLFATDQERIKDFQSKFNKVKDYVRKGIEKGIPQIMGKASDDEIERLNEMVIILSWNLFDKDQLDKIIQSADETFERNGLDEN